MRRRSHNQRCRHAVLAFGIVSFLFLPQNSWAWGRNAHRLIINKAVDTLPGDVRAFFEAGRGSLLQHVTDPLDALAKNPADRRNVIIQRTVKGALYVEKLGDLLVAKAQELVR